MKSLINPIIRPAGLQHPVWSPPDLIVEPDPIILDDKKVKILAMFGFQELEPPEKKEKRSVLHSAETSQLFTSWTPGGMDWQPPFVGRDAWSFIETTSVKPVFTQKYETAQDEPAPVSAPEEEPFDPEKAAGAILRRARAEADEIIVGAQNAADNILLQAQDEIDQQKAEGYRQGLNEAHAEMQAALQATHAILEEVREWQKGLLSQGEQIIVDMLKDIAQTMFGEGVKLDPDALQLNLNRVMESAQGLGDLNIFVNPRDARLLDPSWAEYQLLVSGDRIKVIPSENVKIGGCFVKGSMGIVDARVETQLTAVLKSFEDNKEVVV